MVRRDRGHDCRAQSGAVAQVDEANAVSLGSEDVVDAALDFGLVPGVAANHAAVGGHYVVVIQVGIGRRWLSRLWPTPPDSRSDGQQRR